MIISKIKGGLGNQLFQYAFGYVLAKKNNTNLQLDLSWFERSGEDTNGPGLIKRNCDILILNVDFKEKSTLPVAYFKFSFQNKIRNRLLPLKWKAFIKENNLSFNADYLAVGNNTYIEGFWQSPLYFEKYRSDILRQYTPLADINADCKKWLTLIQNTQSVAVHIRRGDYVKYPELTSIHGVLSLNYYENAMNYMRKQISDVSFFIFTDDWEWVSAHLPRANDISFVNMHNNSGIADMYLIRTCKHQILANSTFSWWGAWLNSYPGKIVIAPKAWYKENTKNEEVKTLLPQHWIRL